MGVALEPAGRGFGALLCQHLGVLTPCLLGCCHGGINIDELPKLSAAQVDECSRRGHGLPAGLNARHSAGFRRWRGAGLLVKG
jgi:hypothetical protein